MIFFKFLELYFLDANYNNFMGVKSLILKQIQIKISDYLLKLLIIFFKKKRENLSLNIF